MMVAYSFQRRFETPIMEGTKRQTIRNVGKRRHARPGDELQLYVGLRTRSARLVRRATCAKAGDVLINFDLHTVQDDDGVVIIGRKTLDAFARADGFENWPEFLAFWRDNHFDGNPPTGLWTGVLVQW